MQPGRSPQGLQLNERRKYTINSRFGSARQYRSRKSRPCDACRKRKTACVILSEPPCNFCKSRGLSCTSAEIRAGPRARLTEASPTHATVQHSQNEAPGTPSPISPDQVPEIVTISPIGQRHVTQEDREVLQVVSEGSICPAPSHLRSEAAQSTVTSVDTPTVHSLEEIGNKTAHCMGLAAEQDTYVLNALKYAIISDLDEVDADIIQVYNGKTSPHQPPVHFLILENEFPDHTNRVLQATSNDIEALVYPHGLRLVTLYFRFVHPAYPILSKGRFLRQYLSSKEALPTSLRGAVYALGCAFWHRDPNSDIPCPLEQHELVDLAHTSLRRELEAPNLLKLQACLLLLHPRPPDIDSVETPSTWILASQATACAQMVGLHRDPTDWKISPWEKSLRKKLWWATYMVDCWSAVCHGNPVHINSGSFDTQPVNMGDMSSDDDVPEDISHLFPPEVSRSRLADRLRFMEEIKISVCLHKILEGSFQISQACSSTQLSTIWKDMAEWKDLIPHCLSLEQCGPFGVHHNAPLHLAFFASQALLYRGLMYPATRDARSNPASALRRWFATALGAFKPFIDFMSVLKDEDLDNFWIRHARMQLIHCGNFLIYLFILAPGPDDVKAAFQLIDRFHQALQRLGVSGDTNAQLLLRPVKLRIDSFFAQATDILKRGGNLESTTPR